ncbi:MAG: hypothetical protein M2R45_01058 [Verrucomicrobia subdivision 3 bacterium]|nr:hypothetical protein [Limisphaerales bacterium]MCS1414170.1 hypothetical protein [Limisphaerales bacterium]
MKSPTSGFVQSNADASRIAGILDVQSLKANLASHQVEEIAYCLHIKNLQLSDAATASE